MVNMYVALTVNFTQQLTIHTDSSCKTKISCFITNSTCIIASITNSKVMNDDNAIVDCCTEWKYTSIAGSSTPTIL